MYGEFTSLLRSWKAVQGCPVQENLILGSEAEIWRDQVGRLSIARIEGQEANHFRLRFSSDIVFDVITDKRLVIDRSLPTNFSRSSRDHLFSDQLVPRILAHEGNFVLHAGASRVGDHAIILMGPSGLGKSTLAASFNRYNGSLLGDDALIVSWDGDTPCVSAIYRSLRLMPDSVKALFREVPASNAVASYTDKQRIFVPVTTDQALQRVPIGAIFLLAVPSADLGIRVRQVNAGEACMAYITNSFALDPTDISLAREKLESASALANGIPTFEISYPRDYTLLPEVHAAMLAQLDSSLMPASQD